MSKVAEGETIKAPIDKHELQLCHWMYTAQKLTVWCSW